MQQRALPHLIMQEPAIRPKTDVSPASDKHSQKHWNNQPIATWLRTTAED
jgi:hypothetical protein